MKNIGMGFLSVGILLIIISTFPINSWAAEKKYPSRQIELTIANPAGGSADIVTRMLAKWMERYLGVPVVCVNKPGGGGIINASYIKNSPPDGYTMAGSVTIDHILIPVLLGQAPFSIEDFRVIGQWASFSAVMGVNADSPWKTFQDFVDYAKKNPGVKYGHPGVGSTMFLRMENLSKLANLGLVGVPFTGDSETIVAVLGNHVAVGAGGVSAYKAQADAGKIRILFSFEPVSELGLDPKIPEISFFGKNIADNDINNTLSMVINSKLLMRSFRFLSKL